MNSNDLPTFTAEDFTRGMHPQANMNAIGCDSAAVIVNRRLAEWKAGLPVVTGYKTVKGDDFIWGVEVDEADTHKAYIFGVSEIKKGVTKSDILDTLKLLNDQQL